MLSVYRNAMEKPVAFYSRQFKDVEKHYAATEPTVCLWWSPQIFRGLLTWMALYHSGRPQSPGVTPYFEDA